MTTNLTAIFEGGAFRPEGGEDIHLSEGTRVRLTFETCDDSASANVLELAAQVYQGLSESDKEEVEQIATDRSRFFSR